VNRHCAAHGDPAGVNGTLPGSIAVHTGGILGGDGSAGAVTVASGSRIAPGNSIDTLTLASADFLAGSDVGTRTVPSAA